MIVVTGATGNIGSQLLDRLLNADEAAGEAVRVVVRDPGRLPASAKDQPGSQVEIIVGSHRDPAVVDQAFAGADTVFWLMPADPTASSPYAAYVGTSLPAADAVVRHGVKRVVTISALGREARVYAGHVSASLAMDDLFRSTGAHVRALTMPSFMDNLLWQAGSLGKDGVLADTLPGDLKVPTAATRDIAAVAARLLLDHTWTGQDSMGVLGPENLSPTDMAAILTEVLGRPVRYERGTLEDEKKGFLSHGYSDAMAQGMVDMAVAKENGLDLALARTPENSTPTSFRQWATEVLKPAVDAA